MCNQTKRFVSLFFDDLPYSEEIDEARKNIESTLEQKFQQSSFEEITTT